MKILSPKNKKEASRRVKVPRVATHYQERVEHDLFRNELIAWDSASAHDFRAFENIL